VLSGYLAYHLGLAFQLGRRTMGQMVVSGTGGVANLALNLLLIPRFGVMGAIWASVVSYALACVVGWRLGRRHFPLPVLPAEAWKVALAAALMAAAVRPLRTILGVPGLALQIGTGAGVYALAAWALDLAGVRRSGVRVPMRGA
jgi:O-antigen/teichoic acid export membrane protein